MRFASFFRNVNVGRAGSPSTAQLQAAFDAAGGSDVATFLTHGNVVFSAASDTEAADIAERAAARLRRTTQLRQPAFTRSLSRLSTLAAADPFAEAPRETVYQQVVSFLTPDPERDVDLPLATPRRDVEVVRLDALEAFSVVRKLGGQAGPTNAFLERVLGAPATTRQWSTVVRLLTRFH